MHYFCLILQISSLIVGSSSRNSNSPKVMNYRQLEKRILDRILSPSIYDSQIRPKGATTNVTEMDGPTKVMVNLYVRSFEKIDDVKMEFSVQITFRQQWNDNRLAFNNIGGKIKYLTMTERNRVWMPDTFFRNEKDGNFHDIIQPNLYVRVFPDGDVLYSIRVGIENSIRHIPTLEDYFSFRSVKNEICCTTFITCFIRLIYIYYKIISDFLCKKVL